MLELKGEKNILPKANQVNLSYAKNRITFLQEIEKIFVGKILYTEHL